MRIVHAFFSDLVHHIKIYFFLGKQCGEKATAYKRNNCPSHVCDFWLKVSVLVLHVEGCMTIFANTKLRGASPFIHQWLWTNHLASGGDMGYFAFFVVSRETAGIKFMVSFGSPQCNILSLYSGCLLPR